MALGNYRLALHEPVELHQVIQFIIQTKALYCEGVQQRDLVENFLGGDTQRLVDESASA